jgi:hypothetical protein
MIRSFRRTTVDRSAQFAAGCSKSSPTSDPVARLVLSVIAATTARRNSASDRWGVLKIGFELCYSALQLETR